MGKYEKVSEEYVVPLKLRIYLLISLLQPITTFSNGLVLTPCC